MFLLYFFCIICLGIAYLSQRNNIKTMKARDNARAALFILLTAAGKLPEEINTLPEWQFALRLATKTWRLSLNTEK